MIPIRILASTALAVALVSCASNNGNQYDTPADPYASTPDAGMTNPDANPIYDTPAAYEESSPDLAPAVPDQGSPAAAPSPPANGSAIIHTVVKGDTLSGLSSKYKVPISSIKQANRMTNDVVVLGRKMVIPPR
jgi:LysM repeat protein